MFEIVPETFLGYWEAVNDSYITLTIIGLFGRRFLLWSCFNPRRPGPLVLQGVQGRVPQGPYDDGARDNPGQ